MASLRHVLIADDDVVGGKRRRCSLLQISNGLVVVGFSPEFRITGVGQRVFALEQQEGCRATNLIETLLPLQLKLGVLACDSGRNHATPRGLLAVIRRLVESTSKQGLAIEDVMPVVSLGSGTLRRRFEGTELAGSLVGKTGTLTAEVDGGMASLAGVVHTRERGLIVFAILDQGSRIWNSRQLEDQLLSEVVTLHASPKSIGGDEKRQLLPSSNLRVSSDR